MKFWALYKNSLRFHLHGNLKITLVSLLCFFVLLMGGQVGGQFSYPLAFSLAGIFGAGILGKDFKEGSLAVTFSRPVLRWQYVLARWTGLVSLVVGMSAGVIL